MRNATLSQAIPPSLSTSALANASARLCLNHYYTGPLDVATAGPMAGGRLVAGMCIVWCALQSEHADGLGAAVRVRGLKQLGVPHPSCPLPAHQRPGMRLRGLRGGSSAEGDGGSDGGSDGGDSGGAGAGWGPNGGADPRRDGELILDEIEDLLRQGDLVSVCASVSSLGYGAWFPRVGGWVESMVWATRVVPPGLLPSSEHPRPSSEGPDAYAPCPGCVRS